MQKLGLLKDSDFKCMHDRKLPVSGDDIEEVTRFSNTIVADVKFLESLRIMDYSLFLIVLEVPPGMILPKVMVGQNGSKIENPSTVSVEEIKMQCNEIDFNQGRGNQTESCAKYTIVSVEDPERKQKEEEFMARLEELHRMGRIVLYSPTKRFCYIMGLIDYLGKWNMNKRLEMLGKSLRAHFIRQNTDFSVKPPDEFARRFIRKVKRIFRLPIVELQPKGD
jgi:hypothetical protein